MSNTSALARQVRALHLRLQPRPKLERWMPQSVHLYRDDEGQYYFLPDQKERWQRCVRAGITPNVYANILPNEDGCCMCETLNRDGRCPCSQKLWDAIDLTSLERVSLESEIA